MPLFILLLLLLCKYKYISYIIKKKIFFILYIFRLSTAAVTVFAEILCKKKKKELYSVTLSTPTAPEVYLQ